MRCSFDLDDTLLINPAKIPAEPKLKFPFYFIYPDRLRKGTVKLIKYLKKNKIEVWIYTTSFRTETYIKNLFLCYGIQLDGIINGARHSLEVQGSQSESMPSKYPSHYRIDLHIDDDKSVLENGKIYGFRVYLIQGHDENWVENIINIITN